MAWQWDERDDMHVGWKIAGAVGLVGVGALALAACSSEKNPNEFAMDEFGKFDDKPKDNKWGSNELEKSFIHTRTQEVNTYRLGDYVHGTRQILQRESTDSMRRIFEAAKGNDAVLSLEELTNFAVSKFDGDKNGTLNRSERNAFDEAYGVATTRTREVLIGSEPFMRYSPRETYPDPNYPGTGNGGTSGGDDSGWPGGNPGNGGTSGGDDGGYIPPSGGNGGNNGGTSGGDDGGGYIPPSGGNNGGSSGSGNSTDNGNPSEDDF